MSPPNPWQRRLRRLFVFAGAASAFYLLSTYTLDRIHQARLTALKQRRQKDLIKSHFTSLLSTISFTLYALLPTLQPQLFDAYPVEATSQFLQVLSNPTSHTGSDATPSSTPAESLILQDQESHDRVTILNAPPSTVGESWASEFQRTSEGEADRQDQYLAASTVPTLIETDDGTSSVLSQSISLPPTDMSSSSPSPPSDLSHSAHLHSSPTRAGHRPPYVGADPVSSKSKKELWRDLKMQSIVRTVSTAYLVPMLYLLTSSQLSVLARTRYLEDVKTALPPIVSPGPVAPSPPIAEEITDRKSGGSGWTAYLPVPSAIAAAVSRGASLLPNPFASLPSMVTDLLPGASLGVPSTPSTARTQEEVEIAAIEGAEAERQFLTYSWWLLHEGWSGICLRVESAVDIVFASLPLKRELAIADWEKLFKEIRANVETSTVGTNIELYDFVPHILPPIPLPATSTPCPLQFDLTRMPHLSSLLGQTRHQLSSPDTRYLLDKGVSEMLRILLDGLRRNEYMSTEGEGLERRRLVDCLPEINRWATGVWEGIPDGGIEGLLALPEYENFAALIFGDWADGAGA